MSTKKLSIVVLSVLLTCAVSSSTAWGNPGAGGEGDCDDKNPGAGATALRGTAAIFHPDLNFTNIAKVLVRLERSGVVKFFRADFTNWQKTTATETGHLLAVCQALADDNLVNDILTAFDLSSTKTTLVVTKNSISDAEISSMPNPLFGTDDQSGGSMTDVVIYAK